jgi:lipid A 3-O-deacylase
MRLGPIVGLSLSIGLAGLTAAGAAEARKPKPVAPDGPSLLSEFRFGFSAQDPWGPERGSANAAGEVLFAKPFTAADLFTSYFVPRPHVGGSLNFDTKTSYAYAGLTWTVDVTPRVFVEGSLGGALHNGSTDPRFTPPGRQALGCSPLFREAGSIGVRLSDKWSMTATVEHLSNGGTCADNRGLTNVGARLGYAF